MAVLARRTWGEIRTETLLRLGNPGATGMDTRVGYWLDAAYRDLCLTYHHFELDGVDTSLTVSTSTNEATIPAGVFIVIGTKLKRPVTNELIVPFTYKQPDTLFSEYRGEKRQPRYWTRHGGKLYFDSIGDAAYPLELWTYKEPTAPDFSSGSPETARDMDEHIIEGALRKGWPGVVRPDLGEVHRQLLVEWFSQQVRPGTTEEPLTNLPERPQLTRTRGGAQG